MKMPIRIATHFAAMMSAVMSAVMMSAAAMSAAVVTTAMISVTAMSVAVMSVPLPLAAQTPSPVEIERWERQAQDITIIRDRWGIAHVYGRTDADAVFGMEYAQAEDDFNRVEMNYIVALGRLAEVDGESAIWHDLRAKLYADPDSLKAAYAASPDALKKLTDAFADGLNYYLHTHPEVKPRVITRFEPWMALSFTEGSIGGDIERISLNQLAEFYGGEQATPPSQSPLLEQAALSPDGPAPEPRGSNGIAIAPKNTLNGHSLLYINPHTSFYFRSELQMTSDEGLNAYGAVTWGQFFIYQGFNERAGWMHTSSGVDNIDWFLETPVNRGGRYHYRYGGDELPMATRAITVPYRTADGMAERAFTAYFTRRGPIVGRQGEQWLSVSFMWQPVNALTQSYMRTKAQNLTDYLKVMELHTNASNNTLFADAEGNVAYLHSNYIPRRDTTFDWTRPVDGSDPATDYRGVLSLDETPNVINPDVGWVYNANNWPWSAAGPDSPRREDYPAYVETGRWETPRGYHALELLPDRHDFTTASLTELGYDSHLPGLASMVPALVKAHDALSASSPQKAALAKPIDVLRGWDYRWGVNSVATSLAVFWGEDVLRRVAPAARDADLSGEDYIAKGAAADGVLLDALSAAVERLEGDFGTWHVPWGHINRFQRISPEIGPNFDDDQPSIPVPFTSARWGSLASFGARPYPNTKKWYGTSGNSFIAVVEFGDSVRARAVTAGGESGDPASPHFNDQAAAYAMGALRDVYFYRPDVEAHMERSYRPGQKAP
jgi:acyl-homoserine-lactone acylase